MTKETILKPFHGIEGFCAYGEYGENKVKDAMDEWAEIQAIAFAEWVNDNYASVGKGLWVFYRNYSTENLTTQQLYHLFKNKNKEQ